MFRVLVLAGVAVCLVISVAILIKPDINCEKVDRRVSIQDRTIIRRSSWVDVNPPREPQTTAEHFNETLMTTEEWERGVCRSLKSLDNKK